jgi:methionine sulfoxide reductase catalytic subunit
MSEIVAYCNPSPQAKYAVFYGYDADENDAGYYEALRTEDMLDPQTILAYEMNGKTLPLEHGAPLRLRCETKVGYKMVKYLRRIEFVEDFKQLGQGRGGYREDTQFYDWEASI